MAFSLKRAGSSAFSVLLLLAALGLLTLAGVQTFRSVQAVTWPSATGTVTRTWLDSSGGSGGRKRIWTPHVAYTYRVDGQTYQGERLSFATRGSSDQREQQRAINRYRVGAPVRVRYAPTDPAVSVLDTGLRGVPWVTWIVGLIVLTLSGWVSRAR